MPLTDDQKALLRLLAQREDGYEDIGALMGLSVDDVRGRVRKALAELDADPERPVTGPAAPGDMETAVVPAAAEPTVASAPSEPTAASGAPSATAGAAPRPTPPPATPPRAPRTARSLPPLRIPHLPHSSERRRLAVLAGGVIALIAAVVIVVVLVSGGGGSGSSTPTSPSEASNLESKKLTQAVLEPVSGGSGEGRALLGTLGKEVVLEVVAKGLSPSAAGESYAIWLYHSPKLALRIGAVKVDKSGGLAVRLPIPSELLAYIAGGAFGQIYVSATPEAAYKAEVAKAKAENRLPAYIGTTVLRGEITGPAIHTTGSKGR